MSAKFNTDDKSFVRVATHDGEIYMVIAVNDGLVPRYDLQRIDGSTLSNIGEYELTPASDVEIEAALAA